MSHKGNGQYMNHVYYSGHLISLVLSFYHNQKIRPATRAYFQLLRRASAFGRGFFYPSGKKELFMLFCPIFGDFWCSVVTVVTFSSNLNNFERNQKNPRKSKKIQKKSKNIEKILKFQKIHTLQKKFKKNPKNSKKNSKSISKS